MTLCQVLEGVESLAKHGHYRAAVAVARARLEPDCDLVTSVMRGWAGQSQADGNDNNDNNNDNDDNDDKSFYLRVKL